jgi:predicted membrane-bound spermidine synthase
MYERRRQRPLPRRHFAAHMARQLGYAAALIVPSLGLGTVVFRYVVRQSWHVAFLNAAMLLSGMGPVGELDGGTTGSIAAALFALYSGLVFLLVAGLLFAPIVHRVLHLFHWEEEEGGAK